MIGIVVGPAQQLGGDDAAHAAVDQRLVKGRDGRAMLDRIPDRVDAVREAAMRVLQAARDARELVRDFEGRIDEDKAAPLLGRRLRR